MTRTSIAMLLLVFGLLEMAVGGAEAQGVARTLDEIQLLVRPGETIRVRDAAGHVTTGRFESSSPAGLQLRSGRNLIDVPSERVAEVRARQQDPLSDGAWKGLGVGVGMAVLVTASCGCPDFIIYAVPTNLGLFAAIGVGLDALVTHERPIFTGGSAAGTPTRFRVAPLVAPGAKGVRVAFQF